MIMAPLIKICGLTRADDIRLANELRVDMCGFVFFEASPRHLSDEQAAGLAGLSAPFIERVALLVDPDDDALDRAVGAVSPQSDCRKAMAFCSTSFGGTVESTLARKSAQSAGCGGEGVGT